MPRTRDYGSEFARRQEKAKAQGWTGYRQQRYWRAYLSDDNHVRALAEEVGGPVEPERQGSLMSLKANRIVNPRQASRIPGDWQLRLLVAAGRI
jgi:hypothetical protein